MESENHIATITEAYVKAGGRPGARTEYRSRSPSLASGRVWAVPRIHRDSSGRPARVPG